MMETNCLLRYIKKFWTTVFSKMSVQETFFIRKKGTFSTTVIIKNAKLKALILTASRKYFGIICGPRMLDTKTVELLDIVNDRSLTSSTGVFCTRSQGTKKNYVVQLRFVNKV